VKALAIAELVLKVWEKEVSFILPHQLASEHPTRASVVGAVVAICHMQLTGETDIAVHVTAPDLAELVTERVTLVASGATASVTVKAGVVVLIGALRTLTFCWKRRGVLSPSIMELK